MKDLEWRPVQATMMTSAPIEAYGGISFSPEMLSEAAQYLNAGVIPFHVDHQLSKPIRMRGFEAFVESRDDGVKLLKFRAEIHEGDQHWLESRTGVSVTITAPIARDEGDTSNEAATMRISADHAWFGDDALIEVEEQLITLGVDRESIRVERAYQFSFVPDPQIFVEIVYPVLIGVGSSAIWDGIRKVFGRRKTPRGGDVMATTAVNISVANGDRSLNATVRANDEAVAKRAMDSLDQALTSFFENPPVPPPEETRKSVTAWDDRSRTWTPPN